MDQAGQMSTAGLIDSAIRAYGEIPVDTEKWKKIYQEEFEMGRQAARQKLPRIKPRYAPGSRRIISEIWYEGYDQEIK